MTAWSAPRRGVGPPPHAAPRGAALAAGEPPAATLPPATLPRARPRPATRRPITPAPAALPLSATPRGVERRPGAVVLPRPRSSALGRLLRGISLWLAVLAVAGLAAVGPLQVLQSSRTATAGYELRALDRERAELSASVRLMEAEIARMANLQAVHAAALGDLGMVRPEGSLRIAVSVPAPAVVPMPERYVQRTPAAPEVSRPWWDRALSSLPGLD